jgi:hypothetical protein
MFFFKKDMSEIWDFYLFESFSGMMEGRYRGFGTFYVMWIVRLEIKI